MVDEIFDKHAATKMGLDHTGQVNKNTCGICVCVIKHLYLKIICFVMHLLYNDYCHIWSICFLGLHYDSQWKSWPGASGCYRYVN